MISIKSIPLIVVLGPTASGKSEIAMALAQKYQGEIICADSRTVYRGMDIGTAKPTRHDQLLVPHHLLDVADPNQVFTAADFKRLANVAIADVAARGRLPIMVGGSGLYIDSVLFDYQFPSVADTKLRAELNQLNLAELQTIFQKLNPEKYNLIDNKNPRRLVRAIELEKIEKNTSKSRSLRANTLVLGVTKPNNVLNERITKRAQKMLTEGIIEEVRTIGETYGWESEAMSGIIYRVFKDIAKNNENNRELIQTALAEFIAGDKKLVKKQLTWFKRDHNIVWLENVDAADRLVAEFVMRAV